MATFILRLSGLEIIGARVAIDGAVIPSDSESVTEQVYDDYRSAKQTMSSDGRGDKPNLVEGVVVIPADSRPSISMTFDNTAYNINNLATITVDVIGNTTYTANKIHYMFNAHYLFQFSGGEATRNDLPFRVTGSFEIKSTPDLKITNPQTITIYA